MLEGASFREQWAVSLGKEICQVPALQEQPQGQEADSSSKGSSEQTPEAINQRSTN